MDEYYLDLKRAVNALESYMANLGKDDYDYLQKKFNRIVEIQKSFRA